MTRKLGVPGVLVLIALAAYFPLRKQARYAKIVTELSRIDGFLVPIEGSVHEALLAAAARGANVRDLDLRPRFVYASARLGERELVVRPAFTEAHAPPGAVMTVSLMDFLRSAADDPKAEGISVNAGAAEGAFSVTLDKSQVLRVLASLRRRGFTDPAGLP